MTLDRYEPLFPDSRYPFTAYAVVFHRFDRQRGRWSVEVVDGAMRSWEDAMFEVAARETREDGFYAEQELAHPVFTGGRRGHPRR